jgi:hypothetical protein
MIVINFTLKIILKALLVAARLWPITLPLGYCAVVGMVLGWDNLRHAAGGVMLISAFIIVFYILRWDFRRGRGGDGKFNAILDEDDFSPQFQVSTDDSFLTDNDEFFCGLSQYEADFVGLT